MLTVQILTRDNEKTLGKTLESIKSLEANVVVGDLGSKDSTLDVCSDHGVRVVRLDWGLDYSVARNSLINDGMNLMVEPWETLEGGHREILESNGNFNLTVVKGGVVSKEIRLWKGLRFRNPVYETLDDDSAGYLPESVLVGSDWPDRRRESLEICEGWAEGKPTSREPWYYLAFSHLALGQTDQFLRHSEKYMAMADRFGPAEMQIAYRSAQAMAGRGEYSRAAGMLAWCLFHRPSFSEFWCLAGDMFFLGGDVQKARAMYRNALAVGNRRSASDPCPLELSKCREHPEKMLEYLEKNNVGIQSREG